MKTKPAIKKRHRSIDFSDLQIGKTFIYNGDLYVKTGHPDQLAICLNDGDHMDDCCGIMVVPVDAEVSWSYEKN